MKSTTRAIPKKNADVKVQKAPKGKSKGGNSASKFSAKKGKC